MKRRNVCRGRCKLTSDLPNLVAAGVVTSIDGVWQRHVAAPFAASALQGRQAYGRWGTRQGFPVLYLGRPLDSVVIEAYRHLVDPVEDEEQAALLAEQLQTRVLVTVTLHVSDLLDLRHAGTRGQLGLTLDVLQSGTEDRLAYETCQRVAQIAHQLGRHGVIAPAASKRGDTIALFTDNLPTAQQPQRSEEDQLWLQLPPDPRKEATRNLRIVRDS